LDLQLHACASCPSVLRILPPTIYVRTRLTCRLAFVADVAGEACFQKPPQGFLYHLDFTYASSAGLLTYAPCILELPPQVGVLGGVRPSAPARSPTRRASLSCPLRWGSWAAYGLARQLLPPQTRSWVAYGRARQLLPPQMGSWAVSRRCPPFPGTDPSISLLGAFLGPRI
jgi:hypothetical protein